MTSRFRTLLLSLLALAPGIALACSTLGPPPTDEELFEKASTVFVAHITKTEEVTLSFPLSTAPTPVPGVEGTFRVVEILKGKPPEDAKVQDLVFGPGNCSLGLFAGLDYLFFLRGDKWVLWPTGSRAFINLQGTEPQKIIEQLRKLKAPEGN